MRSDIIVIGGGAIGLSIGWRLARAGHRVALFDRRDAGRGASWAAAGMLGFVAEAQAGHESVLPLAALSARLWPQFHRDLERASGRRVPFYTTGTLKLARAGQDALAAQHKFCLAHNLDSEWVSADRLHDLEPGLSKDFDAALFLPRDYHVDNRALLAALKEAFVNAGGAVHENAHVHAIRTDGARAVGVRTEEGDRDARIVLLCAGWESAQLTDPLGLDLPLRPVKGEVAALSCRDKPNYVLRSDDVYIVPRADRVVVGATVLPGERSLEVAPAHINDMVRRACHLWPGLENGTIEDSWAGIRPSTPDDLPLLGPCAIDGLILATGHFRNGIFLTPATMDVVSAYVLTGAWETPWSACSLDRFV